MRASRRPLSNRARERGRWPTSSVAPRVTRSSCGHCCMRSRMWLRRVGMGTRAAAPVPLPAASHDPQSARPPGIGYPRGARRRPRYRLRRPLQPVGGGRRPRRGGALRPAAESCTARLVEETADCTGCPSSMPSCARWCTRAAVPSMIAHHRRAIMAPLAAPTPTPTLWPPTWSAPGHPRAPPMPGSSPLRYDVALALAGQRGIASSERAWLLFRPARRRPWPIRPAIASSPSMTASASAIGTVLPTNSAAASTGLRRDRQRSRS
jgi:hypothetical protein